MTGGDATRRRTVFLVAGETSGDRIGGDLARALRVADPSLRLVGIGGPLMRAAGVELIHDAEEFAVLGITEVIGRLPFFLRVLSELDARFRADPPDLFIPIDFPDFNLRLAKRAHARGIPVLWYVSPQVWAWRSGRAATLARLVDRMVVVFPFEVPIYERVGLPVTFVGHPLLDRPERPMDPAAVRAKLGASPGRRVVAILPGSRRQEIERIAPPLLDAARRLEEAGFLTAVSRAPGLETERLTQLVREAGAASILWEGEARDLVGAADLAIVASGTATLETGLAGTPLIVVYRMAALSWLIARRLVRVPHVGLVNIAAGERIAPELLQDQVTGERVATLARTMLDDPERLARMRRQLAELPGRLGGAGAAARTAAIALELLERGAGR
jgi:lipid-A-disaccharide synthase